MVAKRYRPVGSALVLGSYPRYRITGLRQFRLIRRTQHDLNDPNTNFPGLQVY